MTRPDTETLAGFLRARRDWLEVRTQPSPHGGWDVVLRIDGTYSGTVLAAERDAVAHFDRWLADCFANDDNMKETP